MSKENKSNAKGNIYKFLPTFWWFGLAFGFGFLAAKILFSFFETLAKQQ